MSQHDLARIFCNVFLNMTRARKKGTISEFNRRKTKSEKTPSEKTSFAKKHGLKRQSLKRQESEKTKV